MKKLIVVLILCIMSIFSGTIAGTIKANEETTEAVETTTETETSMAQTSTQPETTTVETTAEETTTVETTAEETTTVEETASVIEQLDIKERAKSWSDLELLAHLIYAEAGGESEEVQKHVATVVMNRVASPDFPNSIYSVVFQRKQYECTWNGGIEKTPSATSYEVARWALNGGRSLEPGYVWQANFVQGKDGFWLGGIYFGTETEPEVEPEVEAETKVEAQTEAEAEVGTETEVEPEVSSEEDCS